MPPEIDWGTATTCEVMIAKTIKTLTSRAILQSKKVSLFHQYQICHHKKFKYKWDLSNKFLFDSYLVTVSQKLTENSIHQSVFKSFLRVIYSY